MLSRRILLTLALAVALLSALPVQAQPPGSFPVQYMVKFVCGIQPVPVQGQIQEMVKPGNYATAINIHNYTGGDLFGSKKVSLHYRNGTPVGQLPPILPREDMILYPRRVLEIDCPDIWRMADVPPGTFVKGMVWIGLPQPLPMAAVYPSQTNLVFFEAPDPGAGISIDVENIDPFINNLGAPVE